MTNFQALILGVVQGLTEYLPVSSSAHLVLVPHFFNWNLSHDAAFIFDILVQQGTLLGLLIYFREPLSQVFFSVLLGLKKRDLFHDIHARLGWLVVLSTVPAAFFGLTFKSSIQGFFSSPIYSSGFLILTGILLLIAEYLAKPAKSIPTKKDAVMIGLAQSLALFPGVSRSGSTIAAGMMSGLSRQTAAQFSFLMSIPVMLGAGMIASQDLLANPELLNDLLVPILVGFLSAAVTGYLVIRWFMGFVAKQRLTGFAYYCFVVGVLGLWFF